MARQRAKAGGRHLWLMWVGGVLALVLVALGVIVAVSLHRAEPMLRAVIVEKLGDHFHARVELDSFHISLVNGLWAEGKGLRIWPPAQVGGVAVPGAPGAADSNVGAAPPDTGAAASSAAAPNGAPANAGAPLIRLDEFRFHAPLHYDPQKPIRIAVVELEGLYIDVPPKTHFAHLTEPPENRETNKEKIGAALLHFAIDTLNCRNAHLTLESSKPGKLPLEFAIAQIRLTGVSAGGPMQFKAELTNPKPAGVINTSGTLGPWDVDDPGETPITGDYRFEHADLGVFKGIAGILDSTGSYEGGLRDMTVDGETDTPDFRLTHFGTALPLHTKFHALVDGTNGDTWLQPVDAVLGQSHFTVGGQIVRSQELKLPNGAIRPAGRDIALKVNVDRGKMEDFLRLTSKSGTPLLTGDLTLKTALDIPPGKEPVHERIRLDGNFLLDDAEFTSSKIQNYVGQLSLRGQGQPKDAKRGEGGDVRSAMQSDFKMVSGIITLPDLKYTVPGAEIDLAGKYGIEGSTLDFTGKARTQATVSQMVGGWKGLLLKPADRFFKKDGAGTEVPIHVNGTRENPQFGVDIHGASHTHPALPGQPQSSQPQPSQPQSSQPQ